MGAMTALINIQADKVLTRPLIEFWDPVKLVFKFAECELKPILEEVTNITELPFTRRKPILSVVMPDHRFLHNRV